MGLQPGLHPGRSRLCGGPGQHLEISRQGGRLRRRRLPAVLSADRVPGGLSGHAGGAVHRPGHPEECGGGLPHSEPPVAVRGIHRHRHPVCHPVLLLCGGGLGAQVCPDLRRRRPLRRRAGRLCRLLLHLQCPSGGAPAVGPGLSGAVHRGGGAGRVPGH